MKCILINSVSSPFTTYSKYIIQYINLVIVVGPVKKNSKLDNINRINKLSASDRVEKDVNKAVDIHKLLCKSLNCSFFHRYPQLNFDACCGKNT